MGRKPGCCPILVIFGMPVTVRLDDDLVNGVGNGSEDVEKEAARCERSCNIAEKGNTYPSTMRSSNLSSLLHSGQSH